MILLVGLGNPGVRYQNTRHNLGFQVVQEIVRTYGLDIRWRGGFDGLLATVFVEKTKVLALLPQTFMNRSGQAVYAALQYLKLSLSQVIVFHDDVDLTGGRVRVKRGGGHAGHKGLQSIDSLIGTDYWRVRLGIGHPGQRDWVESYVLANFTSDENAWLSPLRVRCAEFFPLLLQDKHDVFVQHVSQTYKQ